MQIYGFESFQLDGCKNEVAALHRDHYTEVPLYNDLMVMHVQAGYEFTLNSKD